MPHERERERERRAGIRGQIYRCMPSFLFFFPCQVWNLFWSDFFFSPALTTSESPFYLPIHPILFILSLKGAPFICPQLCDFCMCRTRSKRIKLRSPILFIFLFLITCTLYLFIYLFIVAVPFIPFWLNLGFVASSSSAKLMTTLILSQELGD